MAEYGHSMLSDAGALSRSVGTRQRDRPPGCTGVTVHLAQAAGRSQGAWQGMRSQVSGWMAEAEPQGRGENKDQEEKSGVRLSGEWPGLRHSSNSDKGRGMNFDPFSTGLELDARQAGGQQREAARMSKGR